MKLFGTKKQPALTATPSLATPATVAAAPEPIQSFEQLLEHRSKIDSEIKARQQNEVANLKRTAMGLASVLGITIADLLGIAPVLDRKARKKREARPKYKHPTEVLTWSGRGKHPKWMQELLAAGAAKADFLIDKA